MILVYVPTGATMMIYLDEIIFALYGDGVLAHALSN